MAYGRLLAQGAHMAAGNARRHAETAESMTAPEARVARAAELRAAADAARIAAEAATYATVELDREAAAILEGKA